MRRHSEEVTNKVIQEAIPVDGVFWDYLTEARMECCYDTDPIARAEFEGVRKFAATLQDIAQAKLEDEN